MDSSNTTPRGLQELEDQMKQTALRLSKRQQDQEERAPAITMEEAASIPQSPVAMVNPSALNTKKKKKKQQQREAKAHLNISALEQRLLSEAGDIDKVPEGVIPNRYVWSQDPVEAIQSYGVQGTDPYLEVLKDVRVPVKRDDETVETSSSVSSSDTGMDDDSITMMSFSDKEWVVEENWITRQPSGEETFSCLCCLEGELR